MENAQGPSWSQSYWPAGGTTLILGYFPIPCYCQVEKYFRLVTNVISQPNLLWGSTWFWAPLTKESSNTPNEQSGLVGFLGKRIAMRTSTPNPNCFGRWYLEQSLFNQVSYFVLLYWRLYTTMVFPFIAGGRDTFREFLKSEFSDENIDFWLACEDYKKTQSDHLHDKAEKIYMEFVQSDAIKQVSSGRQQRCRGYSNMLNVGAILTPVWEFNRKWPTEWKPDYIQINASHLEILIGPVSIES